MELKSILQNLPEVTPPVEKKLSFNVKLKWTIIVLAAFFIMSNIYLYGLETNALAQFASLAVIMGTKFGTIISLGIGPIVMASIILQLLVGSKILDIDTSTEEGKKFFQGLQKLLVFFFIIFEAIVYVLMGGLRAYPGFTGVVIFQLILGGLAILFLDEICHKWGFGSGVSLFIAAGVGEQLITRAFGFIDAQGQFSSTGAVINLIFNLINSDQGGAMTEISLALTAIIATIVLFLIVVWAQSLKIEIPLSYDRIRGYSMKWPLQFFYASVIPVILTAALVANLQLFGVLLQNKMDGPTFLGNFRDGTAVCDSSGCGILYWIGSDNVGVVQHFIMGSFSLKILGQTLGHILFFMLLAAVFSVFWVKTSGMAASNQAENILNSGLQIPGFRKDKRILESILSRYVMPLTIMGGLAIGLLASLADALGALVGGTALLLGIMITYQFYQNIAQQHAMDMNPALKKMMGV
ncbi:preprotein translocase subunit SecY [Candidatus Pacearchaeota archaeon]|nr:preprotein translocase subunit SecY [Candidatus Pacearchaeota archaeon]